MQDSRVSANAPSDPQTATAVGDPQGLDRPEVAPEDAASDWLCAWCHNRVASERDRFSFEGRDEFVFSSPEGDSFEIITFSQTFACRQSGLPTLAHTWFPAHAWSFCQCRECNLHLGWFYLGQHNFAGLIKNRIVRVACLRN